MKKLLLSLICFLSFCALSISQGNLNMEVLSNVSLPEGHSDVWGFVDSNGIEYAVLGTRTATVIFSLEDPSNPVQRFRLDGANSTWRDMKHLGDFIYVTTDVGSDGLVIIDMTGAPENISGEFWKPDFTIDGSTGTLQTCHNLYIDENGYIYLAGCNLNSGGLIILDAFTTPGAPIYVGAADARYSHDVVVRDNLAYSSDITSGFFSIIDVSDKTSPETLVTQRTTTNFTHNAWFSDDGNYLFTTDERPNAFMDAYDISDFSDIQLLDSYQPIATQGRGVIPHNAHYHNGFLVTSWYTDGVRIIDGSRPSNLVEVGYYDSWDGADGGFNGCWGAYPYLPSGLVLISDIQTGLYVLGTDYVRACYLEGMVTDGENGMALNDVNVEIVASQINVGATNNTGEYKTGLATAGEYVVTFSKPGYDNLNAMANLVNGEITILDVVMNPQPRFSLTGTTLRLADDNPIENGQVYLRNEQFEFTSSSNAAGDFVINDIFQGTYEIFSGAWGYRNIRVGEVTIEEAQTLEIKLEEAYMDDFILDLGWTTETNATTGGWERGEPNGTGFAGTQSNPENDLPDDVGEYCYVTGNGGGDAGTDDVDDGSTILRSPSMNFVGMTNPTINYNLWFFNQGGQGQPNDQIEVKISNGEDEVVLETLDSSTSSSEWRARSSFALNGLIDVTSDMRLIVETGDLGSGHLVEAAIDAFEVTDGIVGTKEVLSSSIEISASPNPFSNNVNIQFSDLKNAELVITNIVGQELLRKDVSNMTNYEWNSNIAPGVYFARITNGEKMSKALKVIKR